MDPRIIEIHKRAARSADVVGLAGGLPADGLLPKEDLARALAEVASSRDDALQYGWPEGAEPLRKWIASRLAARGAYVDPCRIIITAGAQQALSIVGRMHRGRSIAVGDATYAAALDAFGRGGARVVEEHGDARYVIAGVSNPHGIERAIPAGDGPLIVDEAYAELRFDGRVPRPHTDDTTWHIGTISKTIAPGLRVGWLIPPVRHHELALELKHAADLQTASVTQAAVARLVATIDYDALLARARAEYCERAAILADAVREHVDGIYFNEPAGGFSIWVETGDTGDELALVREALAHGVTFDPGSEFRPVPSETIALRLSYSNAPREGLAEGARRLGAALSSWRAGHATRSRHAR